MDNKTAYAVLLASTKAGFNATDRDFAALSEGQQGERVNAMRAALRPIYENFQSNGYGLRTKFVGAIMNATASPKELTAESAIEKALSFFKSFAYGSRTSMTQDEAKLIVGGLDKVELAD